MNKYVSDTMALILRLEKRKMPDIIKEKFIHAEKGHMEILIPAMVFAEIGYIAEKQRIDTNLTETTIYLAKYPSVNEYPLLLSTVKQAFKMVDIPELHDRIIAAAAKELNVPILTNDPEMHDSIFVQAMW